MADLDSSDSVRSAAPLRHLQHATFSAPLSLELGGELPSVTVAYETYGSLNARRDNAVLICHAISGDSHVARHTDEDAPGWWDILVGPGKPIDTDRYFVVCPNVLGGCRGTTGPNSIQPETGETYAADFPTITVGDMAQVHTRLLDHLGLDRLRAVVGGSLGGHQAITLAVRDPQRVGGCVALATSPRLTSQALAFDVVGRNAILHDPGYHGGQYYKHGNGPVVGLALARMLAHVTYLSREAMTAKFEPSRMQPKDVATAFEKKFSVGSYLAYQGDKFVERFDANSYVTLSMAMDLFDLGATPFALQETLRPCRCRWLVQSFSSDWLFPPQQSRQIVDALLSLGQPVTYCNIETSGGHDSFLLEEKIEIYGGMVGAFLDRLGDEPASLPMASTPEVEPTSIFHGQRVDYNAILDLIPPAASVLDLGCGAGELLSRLRARGTGRLLGIELEERSLLTTTQRGLDVVQADLERGLASFSDDQFDIVILSQTLQSISDTEGILQDMVRVGHRAIISFPNFAHHTLRTMLYREGRSPKAEGPYHFEWYNTPNRRFPSIVDVEDLCTAKGFRLQRKLYLDSATGTEVTDDPNWNADVAIFVLSRT